jgi:hypothetical protein
MNLESAYSKWEKDSWPAIRQKILQEAQQKFLQEVQQKILQEAQQKVLQEVRLESQQKVRLEGQRVLVEQMLKVRFGTIDDILSPLIDPLLKLKPEDSSRLLLQASREELLAKLSH